MKSTDKPHEVNHLDTACFSASRIKTAQHPEAETYNKTEEIETDNKISYTFAETIYKE